MADGGHLLLRSLDTAERRVPLPCVLGGISVPPSEGGERWMIQD